MKPRIANNKKNFEIKTRDNVVLSASTIPNPINLANRDLLDRRLKERGARIYNNVHVSGHAGPEDMREFIRMLQPQHLIPAHGDLSHLAAFVELAEEEGYNEIAVRLRNIGLVESHHEARYKKLLEMVEGKTFFDRPEEVTWVCRKCGFVYKGEKPPEKCPICEHPYSYFELAEDF